ncbi:MAG: glycosyltransferase [Saprospiraceae bacterium]|nr:glycosyltransferase [Saprospiraceae bacterium]
MIWWISLSLAFWLAAIYGIGLLYTTIQWLKTRTLSIDKPLGPLTFSIIIPFRNEESTIRDCLLSVLNQQYPREYYEIICVDDHSEDSSADIVRQMAATYPQIKLITNNSSGKKSAIRTGVEYSSYTHLILTDADTHRGSNWLFTFSNLFRFKGIKVIVGTVLMQNDQNNAFQAMQVLDYAGMMSLTITAIRKNWFVNASGANLGVTKDIYLEYLDSGKDANISSGDDVFLLQFARHNHFHSILAPKNKEIVVTTSVEKNWVSFLKQRNRWANKAFQYTDKRMTLFWAFIWLFHVSIIILLAGAIFYQGIFIKILAFSVFAKLTSDYIFLSATASYYKISGMKKFFLAEFYHFIYVIIIGFTAILGKPFLWKNRKYNT